MNLKIHLTGGTTLTIDSDEERSFPILIDKLNRAGKNGDTFFTLGDVQALNFRHIIRIEVVQCATRVHE